MKELRKGWTQSPTPTRIAGVATSWPSGEAIRDGAGRESALRSQNASQSPTGDSEPHPTPSAHHDPAS